MEQKIAARIRDFAAKPIWYHTIELGEGIVTAGVFDHRPHVKKYRFPSSLVGQTVLDVGTSDGFFAFDLEGRGAASVTAIDTHVYDGSIGQEISPAKMAWYEQKYGIDSAVNQEFGDIAKYFYLPVVDRRRIAAAIRGSRVQFVQKSVYDLQAAEETYDLVFCGDLIEHLKNPIGAVERLREVTKGVCIISLSGALPSSRLTGVSKKICRRIVSSIPFVNREIYDSSDMVRYNGHGVGGSFFSFHPETFKKLLIASGFSRVDAVAEFDLLEQRRGFLTHRVVFHCCS